MVQLIVQVYSMQKCKCKKRVCGALVWICRCQIVSCH